MVGLFPAAVLSLKTGEIVLAKVTVCRGKRSLLILPGRPLPHLPSLPPTHPHYILSAK